MSSPNNNNKVAVPARSPLLANNTGVGSSPNYTGGSGSSNNANSPQSSPIRPSSAGRARASLKRRFTTPPEISAVNSGTGSISSLQYYSIFPERENAESVNTDVFITAAETIDDIQVLIINQSDHLRSLRLRNCTQLSEANLHDIIRCVTPKLLSFEIREAEEHNRFDLDHLQHLVSKCKHLRALHFEDCFLIDHRCLEQIGKHLLELQNIAFVHTKRKPWPDNPIHETVLHVPLELHSLKFVGFDEIADYHVNYAVDCYFGSLNAISLGDCSQITDRAIDYIATNCKLLRHIELFKTNITDSTLWILAKHCSNLFYIDLSHCPKITDYGVKELVTHATHLRYINLGGNLKIKDLAFQNIVRHCTSIVRIKLDGTSVTKIPASIIKRKSTLREVSVSMCKEMQPSEIATSVQTPSGLAAFIESKEDRNLNYRLKVFFLGSSGTGKSELIRALIGKTDVPESVREGVNVQSWRPLKESSFDSIISRDISDEERDLCLDLWDCQGRDVLRGVHPLYFTDVCIYFVLCNFEDSASVEKVPKYIHAIYAKALRPQVFVLATHADKYSDEECQKKLELIKRSIDSAELVRRNSINVELALLEELRTNPTSQGRTQELKRQAEDKYQIRKILPISVTTGKGLDVVRKQFLNLCLDAAVFPHLKRIVPPGWVELQDEIMKLRQSKIVCLTWHEFEEIAVRDDRVSKPRLEECIGFLHQVGVMLDLRTSHTFSPNSDMLCIDPAVLAYCACALHIDDQKKSFRFEAKRFWPKDQVTRPPEAGVLAVALEDIPNRGLLKESLLPLIWQEFLDGETQVLRLRTVMLEAALLAINKSNRIASDTLLLPNFPNLRPQVQYVIPLLGLLADAKPQLNWTSRPFHGDVQISLYHYFLPVMPPGLNHRLVALDEFLEISARITAEDENDTTCVESLWMELVYVMNMIRQFMATSWVGVRTTVSLICYGESFYMDERVDTEPEVTLAKVFHYAQQKDDIPFKDTGSDNFLDIAKLIPAHIAPTPEQKLDQWIASLISDREKSLEANQKLTAPGTELGLRSQESSPSVSRPKKKKISINWSVQDSNDHPINPVDSTSTLNSLPNGIATHTTTTNGHNHNHTIPSPEHIDPPAIALVPPKPSPPKEASNIPTESIHSVQSVANQQEKISPRPSPQEGAGGPPIPNGINVTPSPIAAAVEIPHQKRNSTSKDGPLPPSSPRPIRSARKPSAAAAERKSTPPSSPPPPVSNSRSGSGNKARSKACNIL
ncbi:hypothetical protein BV898_02279 [Hypsibius exemplaris]|uniref:F-box/LRR-repeat protein 15-like leucin rich repeat domain-containing protein n=1 Tax=Hypsibius exemplaris TaxID=2072580 RepID=A0A1W0X9J6_HYPEX|nr:hypothetical protein BV898_02279 [Hypsibius exemplaris]